ncbi:tyrosine-type recombinase/integrase, partial [Psychroflexus sp. MES1-P1E]|uniref:tyrosine-type recombinase/integrase n=1 Tax=Psychroflexus sp. MES1-P1E TaxID=2058320 RepID=UPI002155B3AB
LLQKVHGKVHDSDMKLDYSEPKIFTGGVDINSWSKLSNREKKEALSKRWYVYYSFRNPKTGKLARQTNIKGGANQYKDKKSRYHILSKLQESLAYVLAEGFNPYKDNSSLEEFIENEILNPKEKSQKSKNVNKVVEKESKDEPAPVLCSIDEAVTLGLNTKEKVLNENSYVRFKSRINRFKEWLKAEKIDLKKDITTIDKKLVIRYLNTVLQKTSPKNRNNTRTDLGSLFQTLVDNDVIQTNFVREINVLQSKPERNKTYTPKEQKNIFEYLKANDNVLYLFVQFVSYNYLRPIEVCRLKVGDIDVTDKKVYVRAKNKLVKIKIIPDILIEQLPDLSKMNKNDYLFTPDKIGEAWETKEGNKRDFFTKQFKKVKDHFGLGIDYGLYSFRHTFITKLYKEFAKTKTPMEIKSKLQLITGHTTMRALEAYLRDIDAVLPEDYSKHLKNEE